MIRREARYDSSILLRVFARRVAHHLFCCVPIMTQRRSMPSGSSERTTADRALDCYWNWPELLDSIRVWPPRLNWYSLMAKRLTRIFLRPMVCTEAALL